MSAVRAELVCIDIHVNYYPGFAHRARLYYSQGNYTGGGVSYPLVVYPCRHYRGAPVLCDTAARPVFALPRATTAYPGDVGGGDGILWRYLFGDSYADVAGAEGGGSSAGSRLCRESVGPRRRGC